MSGSIFLYRLINRAPRSIFAFLLFSYFGSTQAAEQIIGMAGWEFKPATITIAVGDTITWLNDDDTNHDIAFEIEFQNAPAENNPQKVRSTKKYSLIFTEPGTFNYVCRIHKNYDMKGVIIVNGSAKN